MVSEIDYSGAKSFLLKQLHEKGWELTKKGWIHRKVRNPIPWDKAVLMEKLAFTVDVEKIKEAVG